ncbi:methyltransferase [Phytohabitans sp. ZYX-F-186]|uniref:Methyltransferase n=1 Tax=Phytohabitans maris TaxID=3071409 RepID=A0ABU0ZK44_9ACTN|nr:methyltransferase [Phytohabitans sp. ZYX-F-186]MDQ7907409.1 methyltransferase [Phytohabitans sp. ZYX-F-186]
MTATNPVTSHPSPPGPAHGPAVAAPANGGPPARAVLFQMMSGYAVSQAIHVAVRLGVADLVHRGASTTTELAAATGAHEQSLHRLLRALVALGILTEREPGRFGLTPLGQPLRGDVPDSLRPHTILYCNEAGWQVWGQLLHSVTTGEPAFPFVHGTDGFSYLADKPYLSEAFNDTMAAETEIIGTGMVAAYDFSQFGTVADVGGGNGALLSRVLTAFPTVRGILFDTAAGVEEAVKHLSDADLSSRSTVVAGDFFESVPSGADAYLLKSVIHDWHDDRARVILGNCRKAMSADARLLLVEVVLPATVSSPALAPVLMSDLTMLVTTGGRERTEEEFRTLLAGTGFKLTSVSAPFGPLQHRVIEARPTGTA